MKALESLNISDQSLPATAVVIDAGEGPVWRYPSCCIASVYVRGGLVQQGENWFSFKDLHGLHDLIADYFLALECPMKAEVFRFLRKEMQLTVEEAADLTGTHPDVLAGWEAGDRFSNGHPAARIREIYLQWRQDRVRPTPTRVAA